MEEKIKKINDEVLEKVGGAGDERQISFAQLQMELTQYQKEQAMKMIEEIRNGTRKLEDEQLTGVSGGDDVVLRYAQMQLELAKTQKEQALKRIEEIKKAEGKTVDEKNA